MQVLCLVKKEYANKDVLVRKKEAKMFVFTLDNENGNSSASLSLIRLWACSDYRALCLSFSLSLVV